MMYQLSTVKLIKLYGQAYRSIKIRVPESSTGLYNAFSMYPSLSQYYNTVSSEPTYSKPLSLRYFNKPTIKYTPPAMSKTTMKYKPNPDTIKQIPISMRWYNQP